MPNFAAATATARQLETPAVTTRDTIQIMRDMFEPEQLQKLLDSLDGDGQRFAIVEGHEALPAALRDPRTLLLLLEDRSAHLEALKEALQTFTGNRAKVSILLYVKDCRVGDGESLMSEIDDFLLAPLSLDDLCWRIRRLVQRHLQSRNELESARRSLTTHFGMRQFIGSAPAFIKAMEQLPRLAACDAAALLIGDTGTGKEMCARAIHYLSARADNPFVPINCGAIPSDLFENEIFGHAAGAFTDARQAMRGLIAEAEGGTLFLDEVNSLSPSAQAKLLRFLQDKQYRPLGASGYRQANVRVIAATNQGLLRMVQEGTFREDLYYRLRVVSINLPPLRERQEDIAPLALHFFETAAREYVREVTGFSSSALRKLSAHTWPGNVRELENVIRQAVVLAAGPVIQAHNIQLSTEFHEPAPAFKESLKVAKARVLNTFERTYLQEMLVHCGGNISRAARESQKDRRTFFELLKKHGLASNACAAQA
ncbi:MAG: hypothetical protein QOH51_1249 [Acidobacteriota bacterium]|jgi:DNA-binding NtrC family response regulator|nr:hypothetical protein [Acidobacteriota bacterium]